MKILPKRNRAWHHAHPRDWYAIGCIFAPLLVKKEAMKCPRILLVVDMASRLVVERFMKPGTAATPSAHDIEFCVKHLVERRRPECGIVLLMSAVGSTLSLAIRKSISFQVVPLVRAGCAFGGMSRADRNRVVQTLNKDYGLQCHFAHVPQLEDSFRDEWECLRTNSRIKHRTPMTIITPGGND